MTNEFRALCAELVDSLHKHTSMWEGHEIDLVTRARALLAQPEPVAPTDEELIEVFWEHQNGMEELWVDDWPAAARAVLARWGQP